MNDNTCAENGAAAAADDDDNNIISLHNNMYTYKPTHTHTHHLMYMYVIYIHVYLNVKRNLPKYTIQKSSYARPSCPPPFI